MSTGANPPSPSTPTTAPQPENADDLIDKARAIIDKVFGPVGNPSSMSTSTKYDISINEHAIKLQDDAPALARAIREDDADQAAQDYLQKNEEAKEARNAFQKTAYRANWAILIASAMSTLLVLLGAFLPSYSGVISLAAVTVAPAQASSGPANEAPVSKPEEKSVAPSEALIPTQNTTVKFIFIAFTCSFMIIGSLAALWMNQLQSKHLLENFRTRRAEAEMLRTKFFQIVANALAAGTSSGEIPFPLLQLEYVRRNLLEDQIKFYTYRGKDHAARAAWLLDVSLWSAAVASAISALASFLGAAIEPRWATVAALGAIGTAVARFATSQETFEQNSGNEDRYRKAAEALRSLKSAIGPVRQAAAAGQSKPVQEFVAGVVEQMSHEHTQWLESGKQISESLDRLNQALIEARALSDPTKKEADVEKKTEETPKVGGP